MFPVLSNMFYYCSESHTHCSHFPEEKHKLSKITNCTQNPTPVHIYSMTEGFTRPPHCPSSLLVRHLAPLIIFSSHPYLTFDLSHDVMGLHRGLSPKPLLAVRVSKATWCCWGISQADDWVHWVSVGRHRGKWSLTLEKRRLSFPAQPGPGAPVLSTVLPWVPTLVLGLVVQQSDQEVDVLDCQAQDLIFAELLVRRVCGDQFSQLKKRAVNVLLPPALPAVGEDTAGEFLRRAWSKHTSSV